MSEYQEDTLKGFCKEKEYRWTEVKQKIEVMLVEKEREKEYIEISADYIENETHYGENRQGSGYRRESGNRSLNWNNNRNKSGDRS